MRQGVHRLTDLMLGAELADRRALEALEHDEGFRPCVPLASWHG